MMRSRPCPLTSLASLASLATLAVACSIVAGCADAVPDPKGAVDEYRRAAERGDGDALYAMLTEGGQRERSREDIKRTVAEQRGELAERGKLLAATDTRVEAVARLRFDDGEEATLDLRQGRFQVTASSALPGGARTPEQALVGLRHVLARRSYAGLMRVLSPSTRAAVENDLRSLVVGLERPEALDVRAKGDVATVLVPGGHHVRLRREAGIWRVDDFD
ncbi:MAG TPA: hypothetical protein PK141_07275 [Polyangiaceae bacterium]|jgi:hypothetical protein|nr:hypothetical protein [Polyangiaceae bacterium]